MSVISEVDSKVKRVASNKNKWTEVPIAKKLEYLLEIQAKAEALSSEWGLLSSKLRKYDEFSHLKSVGSMISFGFLGFHLIPLIETYTYLRDYGQAPPALSQKKVNDQEVITVYPWKFLDKMFTPGAVGEIWLEPGKPATQGSSLKNKEGKLCVILGAGNFDAPTDIIYKMFNQNHVCIYKPNPVNESAVAPIIPRLFQQLIQDGFLEVVVGGIEVGQALLNHPLIDEAMMTGSAGSYDRIVWGSTKEEQEKNKKSGNKLFSKPFEAELGAVSPYMIVPGKWSSSELETHAEMLVASKMVNSSAVCASPQLLLTDKDWPQRKEFLELIRKKFKALPPVPVFYPGTEQRCSKFKSSHSTVEEFPSNFKASFPLTTPLFATEVSPDSLGTQEECFAPFLSEVALSSGNDPVSFMQQATDYVNKKVFGSLSCTIIIDPRTQSAHSQDLEKMIANLEWGAIGVNTWGGNAAIYGILAWGAYPKHSPKDIQSGMGKVGNARLYDYPQKSVYRMPFISPLNTKLPSQADEKILYRLSYFSIYPTWWRLFSLMSAALTGF